MTNRNVCAAGLRTAMAAIALAVVACSTSPASDEPSPSAPPPVEQARDFEVVLAADKLPVLQGTSATAVVTLTRKNGFAGDVTVTPVGLPSGVTAAPITFSGAATEATLTVSAAPGAAHSLPTAVALEAASGSQKSSKTISVTVVGRPGALDTSFAGGGGKLVLPMGDGDDYGNALAVQADGKILIAGRTGEGGGDFAIARLDRDGVLDPTFGSGGKVRTAIGSGSDTANAIAVQPDGKIVVAGSAVMMGTGQDFALVRYLPDGTLDASFGDGGRVTTSFTDDSDTAYTLLLQPDGKIVVAGDANEGTSGLDFAIARFDANGALDASFGQGGKATTSIAANGGRDSIYALALQDVAGEPCILAAGGEGDFAIARYTHDGKLDSRFGASGKVAAVFGSVMGAARGIQIAPDGKVILGGHQMHAFALVRLTATGALDASFGADGKVVTQVSATNANEVQSIALEADGKILAGGWVNEIGTSANFALARYDGAGKLDLTFGEGGIVVTELAASKKTDLANAMVLQRDDRVPAVRVLLGGYVSTSNFDFAVTRYWR